PLARGAPVAEGAAFDVEVVLADVLRRRGHPDPRIAVAVTPVAGRRDRVDVAVRVEPGPRVEIVFAGDRPPLALRREIAALYRIDFYEPAALAEMKQEAIRAFRGQGHLDPRVEIEARARPDGTRTVTVRAEAGSRAELRELAIEGLDPESAAVAARRFAGTLARVELAAGLPDADRRLLETLRTLGYSQARIVERTLEETGGRLAVRVEPGERRLVAAVSLEGVGEEERRRLAQLLPVAPGDAARLDRIAEGALLLERALAGEGHPDATVRPSVHPATAGGPLAVEVRYTVSAGPRLALADVAFEGERWTRPKRLERIAGLETGGPFTTGAVEEARARLFRSGSFARVTAEVDRADDGAARVRFSLAERPRFRLGYGVRWESAVGPAAVVDLADANFLGRGLTLGLRGLYESDDRSGRLFLRTGAFSRGGLSLEGYAQGRRRLPEENLVEDSLETALQLARPVGARTTARLYARYRTTRLYEEEPDPFFPLEIEIAHPYLGTQLLYEARDDALDPADGLFASLDLSGSGAFAGSDFDYARAFGQLQLYRGGAARGRRLVWAQSLRLGWARAFGGQELLRFERFFAGGEHSVRGYPTEGLGPREVLGDLERPLGGEVLLVVNEELRMRLPWDLTGLVFLDAGQVWADAADVGPDLATALGLGLRAPTPVGLLRLDAAFPLDRRPGDDSFRFYVGFGNAF
ncbi:MAG TPA: BamA/TamA family outer membrane protein, partial [Thermoanaerobaculia bacterium]|nr:BamA/TamA family outer membrane protein [Thermoanaerobaculia bacterium]